ncbi:MAG: hypothetical protein JNK57_17480 [Planctomycetaceae bacterium]|nr:hypothetical protein [Planctomycetaceae bacterium]
MIPSNGRNCYSPQALVILTDNRLSCNTCEKLPDADRVNVPKGYSQVFVATYGIVV